MNWKQIQRDHQAVIAEVFGRLRPEIEAFAREVVAALRAGNKVMICGNGGSAADAQHIAGEFINAGNGVDDAEAAIAGACDNCASAVWLTLQNMSGKKP